MNNRELITFHVQDGQNEYETFGIYNRNCKDEQIIKNFYCLDNEALKEEEHYWDGDRLVGISDRCLINEKQSKTLETLGIAYYHKIKELT